MTKKRTTHSAAFKAKVALAAIREQETIAQIVQRFRVHQTQVHRWKKQLLDNIARAFEADTSSASPESSEREAELLQKIGELTVERDFLSKGLGRSR